MAVQFSAKRHANVFQISVIGSRHDGQTARSDQGEKCRREFVRIINMFNYLETKHDLKSAKPRCEIIVRRANKELQIRIGAIRFSDSTRRWIDSNDFIAMLSKNFGRCSISTAKIKNTRLGRLTFARENA